MASENRIFVKKGDLALFYRILRDDGKSRM